MPRLGHGLPGLECRRLAATGTEPVFHVHDELGGIVGPYSRNCSTCWNPAAAAQTDPLSIIISTQARSDSDLLSRLIDDAQTRRRSADQLFLYTADAELDLLDEDSWRQANPALGGFLRIDEIRAQAESAMRMPSMEAHFRNLHRNERIERRVAILSASVWRENGDMPSELEGARRQRRTRSRVSERPMRLVLVNADDGSCIAFAWLPESGLSEKSRLDKNPYDGWAREGLLLTCPGRAVSFDHVAEFLREVFDRCTVQAIAFDRAYMKFLRPCLVRAGFTEDELAKFIEHGQGFLGMAPAIRELEVSLLEKKLRTAIIRC